MAQNPVVITTNAEYSGQNKKIWRKHLNNYFQEITEGAAVSKIPSNLKPYGGMNGQEEVVCMFNVE